MIASLCAVVRAALKFRVMSPIMVAEETGIGLDYLEVELGLLERLHWGVYRISYLDRENLLRELCIRLARRDIERHVKQKNREDPA